MLKKLFGGRKHESLVEQARTEVIAMLEHSRHMFDAACCALLVGKDVAAEDVRAEDREMHAEERLARRLIVTHLTVDTDRDLPGSLAILSITHDAERIGDYAKSLMELNTWSDLGSRDSASAVKCKEIHQLILPLFDQTIAAVREGNPEIGVEVMRCHSEIKPLTDAVLAATMEDEGADRGDFLHTLASRFLRRVSAHLSNIASSIANPLDLVSHNEGVDAKR